MCLWNMLVWSHFKTLWFWLHCEQLQSESLFGCASQSYNFRAILTTERHSNKPWKKCYGRNEKKNPLNVAKNSLIVRRNLLLATPHHLHFPEELVGISHFLPQISYSTCIKWFFDRRAREKQRTWFRRQTPSLILFFLCTVWEHYKLLLFKALWFVRLSWIFAWRVYQKHRDTYSLGVGRSLLHSLFLARDSNAMPEYPERLLSHQTSEFISALLSQYYWRWRRNLWWYAWAALWT